MEGYKIEFFIGQVVYLKTDREQHCRIITGISFRPYGCMKVGTMDSKSQMKKMYSRPLCDKYISKNINTPHHLFYF